MKNKKMKKNTAGKTTAAERAAAVLRRQGRVGRDGADRQNIVSDILGSYTGTSEDGGAPEQDADDL